jgi:hypothetical protein
MKHKLFKFQGSVLPDIKNRDPFYVYRIVNDKMTVDDEGREINRILLMESRGFEVCSDFFEVGETRRAVYMRTSKYRYDERQRKKEEVCKRLETIALENFMNDLYFLQVTSSELFAIALNQIEVD